MTAVRDTPTFLWDDGAAPVRRPRPVAAPSDRHVPAEAGVWVFVLGDMTIFGAFFAVFAHDLSENREVFAESARALHQPLGVVNTLLLLVSSYLVVLALRGRRGSGGARNRWLLGAVGCGGAFLVSKAVEYSLALSAGHTPASGTFFTFYYVLTGVHLLHVVIGITLLLVWHRASEGSVASRPVFQEGAAVYWHMVDLLWLVIFALVYLGAVG